MELSELIELRGKYEHPSNRTKLGFVSLLFELGQSKPEKGNIYQHYETEGIIPTINEDTKPREVKPIEPTWKPKTGWEVRQQAKFSMLSAYGTHPRDNWRDATARDIIDRIINMKQGYPNSPVKIRKKDYETDRKLKAAISIAGKDLLKEYLCDDCDDRW